MFVFIGICLLSLVLVLIIAEFILNRDPQRLAQTFFELLFTSDRPLVGQCTIEFGGKTYNFGADEMKTAKPFAPYRPRLVLLVKEAQFFADVIINRNLGIGEAYMRDWIEFKSGNMFDFIAFAIRNNMDKRSRQLNPIELLRRSRSLATFTLIFRLVRLFLLAKFMQLGTWMREPMSYFYQKFNLHHVQHHQNVLKGHYGVHPELYHAMLGELMVYTCGFLNRGPASRPLTKDTADQTWCDFFEIGALPDANEGTMSPKGGKNKKDNNNGERKTRFGCVEGCHPLLHADESLKLDLDELQHDKLKKICEKLRLRPGSRVLDVGCGWGGFSIFAAKHYGVHATGFALTEEMVNGAKAQAKKLGVYIREEKDEDYSRPGGSVRFIVGSHHTLSTFQECYFDAVAAIGIFEHIFLNQYEFIFAQTKRILKKGGWALFHQITSPTAPNKHDKFIQKYIFPESRQVVMTDMVSQCERQGMYVSDIENIGPHYCYTLKCWLDRSNQHFAAFPDRYERQFIHMWRHYLECCIAMSAFGDNTLTHIVFTKETRILRPLVRDNWVHSK